MKKAPIFNKKTNKQNNREINWTIQKFFVTLKYGSGTANGVRINNLNTTQQNALKL